MDYYNSNGLVNGKIPEKRECPFLKECTRKTDNCPSIDNKNIRTFPFSCALARLFSLNKESI